MPKRRRNFLDSKVDQECDQSSINSSSDETDNASSKSGRITRRSLARQESVTTKQDGEGEKKSKKLVASEQPPIENGGTKFKSQFRMSTRGKQEVPSELLPKAKDSLISNKSVSDKISPKKNKTGTSKRSHNPLGMSEHELLMALDESGGRLRKRKFNQSYQVDMKQCPVAGCDSRGHLMGKYERHFTLAACPIYHNLTPERCRENYEAYLRIKQEQMEEAEELEKQGHHNTRKQADVGPTPSQLKYEFS